MAKSIVTWIGSDIITGNDFTTFLVEAASPGYSYPPRGAREFFRTSNVKKLSKARHRRLEIPEYDSFDARLTAREAVRTVHRASCGSPGYL